MDAPVRWLTALSLLVLLTFASAAALAQNNGQQFGPVQRVADGRPQQVPLAQGPAQPDWMPISQPHQQYIDQLLGFWEKKSSQIDRYRCHFQRWQWDPVFGPRDTYYTYSVGTVQYSAPDKGMFQVESKRYFTLPKTQGERPTYEPHAGDPGEHWVCDGKAIWEFDYKQKKLIERELPPDMQGKAIVDGPLPFMFGAKMASIKARYWLRVITPAEATEEYWLEAVPKTMQDAANFKKVEVIIAREDYLPKAIQIYPVNYDPRTNPSRTVFQFERREVNFRDLQDLIPFNKQFYEPATPSGWEKQIERYAAPPQVGRGAPAAVVSPYDARSASLPGGRSR
ncbi:MAG: TIGR03009 domain-containing protein [Pirellulaceae bacterium]